MKRRHLWILTTACCAVLALPTVSRLIGLVVTGTVSAHAGAVWRAMANAAVILARSTSSLAPRASHALVTAGHEVAPPWPLIDRIGPWRVGAPVVIGVIALAAVLVSLTVLFVARRRSPVATRVRRLARRGRAVSTIARHTGLSQDAVRHVLCPEPPAGQGRFATALAASLDGSYGPATAYGRDR